VGGLDLMPPVYLHQRGECSKMHLSEFGNPEAQVLEKICHARYNLYRGGNLAQAKNLWQ